MAIKLNSKSWTAYNGIADCYSLRNQYQHAIKYYDRVITFLT